MVAYVRKVRTASGAVAVQVARKDHGRVVILAHLGSAHTDAELGVLLHAAQPPVQPTRWAITLAAMVGYCRNIARTAGSICAHADVVTGARS